MSCTRTRSRFLARRATIGLFAVAFLACGGGEAGDDASPGAEPAAVPETEAPPSAGVPEGEAPSGPAPPPGEVGSFTARVTGARDTVYSVEGATGVETATNCSTDRPARVSFTVTDQEDLPTRFRAITGVVLEPGQTGSFPADTVTYWYPRMGLPSQTTYVGHGTLEITHHDARRGAPRLVGRIEGREMRDPRGEAVEAEVEFDIGWSCGFEE